jgi:hypothetical protein
VGDHAVIRFVVGEPPGSEVGDAGPGAPTTVRLIVPVERVDQLAGLFTGRTGTGRLGWLPGVRFVVVP